MKGILDYVRGRLKLLRRRNRGTDDGPGPDYGDSVSYLPCPACGEGSLVYDDEVGESVCRSCGATDDRPE